MKTNCLGHRRVCLSREKAFACETVEYMYRYSDISAQILYVSRHSPAVDLTIENNAVMGYTAIQIYSQFPDYINSSRSAEMQLFCVFAATLRIRDIRASASICWKFNQSGQQQLRIRIVYASRTSYPK